jgi:hypothetical protein
MDEEIEEEIPKSLPKSTKTTKEGKVDPEDSLMLVLAILRLN